MKYVLSSALCGVMLLSGCGEAGYNTQAACAGMIAGDTRIEEDLAGMGSSIESYCSCFEATLSSRPEATQETVLKVVSRLAEIREADGVSLDDAADQMEDESEAGTSDITEAQFEMAGEFVDTVRKDLDDNAGQCTFSTS